MSRIPGASRAEVIHPTHRIFHTSQSDVIRLGRRIGVGGEGKVYEIQDRGDLVAKIYHEPPAAEKAEKLIALSRLGNERLFNLSAWPVDVLRGPDAGPEGAVIGFVMKKVSQAEEVHSLHSPKSRLQKFPEASWAFLIYVAANIARAVTVIHEHGLVIGDVNPKNILVTRKATIHLLDVDSFQVSAEGRTYRCDGGFPEYTPPELQGVAFRDVDRRQEHDCFGLAIVIFQLLFLGRHPFSGRFLGVEEMSLERAIRESRFAYGADAEVRKMRQPPGTLALDSMPPAIVDLFRRAFLGTARPQPREWIEPLEALAKSLKKCAIHSGHHYYEGLSDCPWCGIETHARVRLFNFLLPGADSRREQFRLDEIWKEIVSVEIADAPMISKGELSPGPGLSPGLSQDVADAVRGRRTDLARAILLSASLSLIIGLVTAPPLSFLLLAVLVVISRIVFFSDQISLSNLQTLFQNQQSIPDNPLVRKVRDRHLQAEGSARRLEEQYAREAGIERLGARRDELRNRKETYESLAQIRQFRLQELEADEKKSQLNEFLDQFEINDAEIKGVISPIKAALLSHGVETAADVIEEVKRIPSVGYSQGERLLEWRRDLERRFVFDPRKGASTGASVKVEKEIDALRFRLESELLTGAQYLRRAKQEIEVNRQKLQPALLEARQELAQAEKDWKAAIKRNPFAPIMVAIIIAFLIGWKIGFTHGHLLGNTPATHRPPPASAEELERKAAIEQQRLEALSHYHKGVDHSARLMFEDAATELEKAVDLDPNLYLAHEELSHVLLSLKRYDGAEDAATAAIGIQPGFRPFYNRGLVYFETGRWQEAMADFQRAIDLRDISDWKDEYTQAYYYLGLSQVNFGGADRAIQSAEEDLKLFPDDPIKRFELAVLYLCVGELDAARREYKVLKNRYHAPLLAEELRKLIERHAHRNWLDRPEFSADIKPT